MSEDSEKKDEDVKLRHVDFAQRVKEIMEKEGKTEEDAVMDVLFNTKGFIIDETVLGRGYASLDQMGPWTWSGQLPSLKVEMPKDTEAKIDEYRRLREEFAPVSAGIEWHRGFTSGSGFNVLIDDIKDDFKKKVKDDIIKLNMRVYQDDYTVGLDHILDILVDATLTDGAAAAEIVYGDADIRFEDYVAGTRVITLPNKRQETIYDVVEPDWKNFKQGITRLKIIKDAVTRMKPVRDNKSYEVLYWILDEMKETSVKLHTWQVLWVSWNTRGTQLIGNSLIKPVYTLARLLEQISECVGINFKRWSDRKYFFVCVPPWTEVWTPNGYRQIKDIGVGDNVWSQHSIAEVLQTFQNPYKGDLITIKTKMLEPVSFTPNHPIKVAKKYRLRTKEGHEKYLVKFEVLDGYKRADELTTDDYVIVPKIKESHDIWIDFPNLQHKMGRGYGRNPETLPSQYLSEDLAKLFGWYLAEGCLTSSGYGLRFCLGKTETHHAKEIIDLLWETLGLRAKTDDYPTSLVVQVNSKSLAEFMVKWFGKGANSKHLPETFLYWKPEILQAMISRILMGDGHLGKDNWWKLKLNSKTLQKQLQLILLKLGHRAGLSFVERDVVDYIQGRQINQHDAWTLTWNENNKSIAEDEDNYYFRIMEITRRPFEGYIYNLHTSMNEYLTPFVIANCGTEKRPWGKAHMANFVRDVKRMREKNLSAIPVPAGFDVKDIGGEVFEGRAITDYLVGMIAAGMQYPKEFLETGRTRASDKAWLAWLVRYGRNQLQLRRAIEHQLWKRHLWCLYGRKQRVPKQGVAVDQQDLIDTYVPRLEWKAEGKWAKETKIKMLKMIGDMANPATPPLHLAMQKDMAETLGYGELNWDDIIEYTTIRGEINLIEAKRELLRSKAQLERDKELAEKKQLAGEIEKEKQAAMQKAEALKGPKVPTEEELKERQEKRLEGGVSVTKKPKKGVARPMGGPRKVVQEEE